MAINTRPDVHEQIICANIFIKKDGKFLVLKRSPLKRYAPNIVHPVGGKVDLGENPLEAAIREVAEEAGITVKNLTLRAVITEIQPVKDEPYNWLIFHFFADYDKGKIISTEEGELVHLTASELLREKLFPSVRYVIDDLLSSERVIFATVCYDEEGVLTDDSTKR